MSSNHEKLCLKKHSSFTKYLRHTLPGVTYYVKKPVASQVHDPWTQRWNSIKRLFFKTKVDNLFYSDM